ncbi:MAG: flagellar basal body P-ring formation protein FlgA, partial [Thermodesulfobacteria bacterium]|nr:flagellar basal body P-ring formation protein FlgA [Thermodesulfobacteriota bacterium]
AQPVDTESLKEAFVKRLKNAPALADSRVEVSSIRVLPKKIWVPMGKVSFSFDDSPSGQRLGRVSSMVTILVDGKPVRKARVCAYVEVYKKVLCAKRGLVRGQLIGPEDLSLVMMPISKLRGGFFDSPSRVVGLAAKRSIRPGQVIFASAVSKPVLVKRGSRVLIVASSNNLRITVPGIAQEKGAQGDFVRVKNIDSNRVVIARVKDSDTVVVTF